MGLLPSESFLFRSAFFLIRAYTIGMRRRTTAKWTGLPKIPPPLLTSAPPSIKHSAAS